MPTKRKPSVWNAYVKREMDDHPSRSFKMNVEVARKKYAALKRRMK